MVFLKQDMGEGELTSLEVEKELDEPLHLDLAQLAEKGYAKIKGPSGRSFKVSASYGHLAIDAIDNKDIYLDMTVVNRDDERFLSLGINTRGKAGEPRHPDLHAGRLVDKAIAYFEQDKPLRGIDFNWHNKFQKDADGNPVPSETLREYRAARQNRLQYYLDDGLTEDEANEQAKHDAAFSTWTGRRVALKHGFTEIQNMDELKDDGGVFKVVGEFVRPQNPPPDQP
jgi:hypothetical protein